MINLRTIGTVSLRASGVISLVFLAALEALAQVPTTITSSGLNTQVSAPSALPSGQSNYDITGGTRPGGGTNLFHGFGEFNVGSNSIANFLNETGLPTNNILARVTGGNPSNIFGTLQTTGFGNANLFLVNPAGVVFGPDGFPECRRIANGHHGQLCDPCGRGTLPCRRQPCRCTLKHGTRCGVWVFRFKPPCGTGWHDYSPDRCSADCLRGTNNIPHRS